MHILFPAGNACISSLLNTFNATIANTYIIAATAIAISVANFVAIIPESAKYVKYEHIPIIAVAITGFNTYLENLNFILNAFFKHIIDIVIDIAWQATDAQAAPFTPIDGIGTNTRFNISFAITPYS